jgi:hypothetical protein
LNKYLQEVELDAKDIIEYLFSAKKYYFSDVLIDIQGTDGFRIFSSEILISETIRAVKDYINQNNKLTKLKLVKFIYKYLHHFKSKYPELKERDELSHYKLTVITGLIILKLKPDFIKNYSEYTFDYSITAPVYFKQSLAYYTKDLVKGRSSK